MSTRRVVCTRYEVYRRSVENRKRFKNNNNKLGNIAERFLAFSTRLYFPVANISAQYSFVRLILSF